MKSDREFLDGIYEKATMLEQTSQEDTFSLLKKEYIISYKKIIPIIACCVLVIILLPSIGNLDSVEKNKKTEGAVPNSINMIEEESQIQQRGVFSPLAVYLVTGSIIKVKKEEEYSYITLQGDGYYTDVPQENQAISLKEETKIKMEQIYEIRYKMDLTAETEEYDFVIDEMVLLYLIEPTEETDGYYTIANGEYGKYSLKEDTNKIATYIGKYNNEIIVEKEKVNE